MTNSVKYVVAEFAEKAVLREIARICNEKEQAGKFPAFAKKIEIRGTSGLSAGELDAVLDSLEEKGKISRGRTINDDWLTIKT